MSTSIHPKKSNAKTLEAGKPEKPGKKEVRAQVTEVVEDALTNADEMLPSQAVVVPEPIAEAEQWQMAQLSSAESTDQFKLEETLALNSETQVGTLSGVYSPLVMIGSSVLMVTTINSDNGPSAQDQALSNIKDYAQRNANNNSNQSSGSAPTLDTYTTAGIRGVNKDNIKAINNILESAIITGDSVNSKDKLQEIVDCYNSLLVLSDGNANNATVAQALTVKQIGNIGIDTTGLANGSNPEKRMSLLNNLLDNKSSTDVESVAKIQAIVKWVNDLSDFSAGKITTAAFKQSDFQGMGISGVSDANLNVLLDEIKQSGAGSIGSMSDINALITKSNTRITAAYQAIQNYAEANADPTVAAKGTEPTLQNYQDVGVVRLDDKGKDAVNTALTTLKLKSANLQTTADIQKVVDAYNAVFALAEGTPNNATPQQAITVDTLNNLGIDTTQLSNGAGAPQRISLLNNVLDAQQKASVITIAQVNDLVKYVNAVADQATGLDPSYNMQAQDFEKLGIQGVDANNLADIQQSIAAQKNHAPFADLAQLQSLVNFYKIAPLGVRLTQDTGIDTADLITRNGAITVDGTLEIGATLEYSVNGGRTYTSDYTLPSDNSVYTVWVRQVSAQWYFGKSSQLTFTYDALGPQAPTLDAGTLYFGIADAQADTSKLTVPNATVPASQDIAKIQLTLTGIDSAHDQWVLDVHAISLNGVSQQSNNQSVAGVNIDWQYTLTNGNNHTLVLTKNGGGKFSDTDVANIEKAMAFQSLEGREGKRTLSVAHIDVADNLGDSASRTLEIDLTSPELKLTANTPSYTAKLRATPGSAITDLTNGASVTDAAPIKSLNVSVKNVQDNERLVINNGVDASINLYGVNASGSANVTAANGGAGTWFWSYNSASNSVVFSLTSGQNASAAQASALLQALQYQNASTNSGHSGVREVTFTTTDAADNTSSPATTTLNYVATVAKVATTAALDNNADGVLGDQFVVSFTELVEVNNVQNTNNWTVANSVKSTPTLGAISVQAVDVQKIGGVDYAKHFWVKSAADSTNWVVGQQQTFNFGNQLGANQQAYLTLPTKPFGGDLTLEAWLFMDKKPGNFARIFDLGTDDYPIDIPNDGNGNQPQGSENIIFGFNHKQELFFQIYNGRTTTNSTVTANELELNTWYHLAVIIDNERNAIIYINGVEVANAKFASGANDVERNRSYINKSAWEPDGYLSGNIFDARVYDNARTADEIKNDFKGLVDPTDRNQVFLYNLNGDLKSGLANGDAAIGVNATFDSHNPGTTFSINADKVVDTTGQITADQTATLYKSSNVNGSVRNDTLEGTDGDDFITGQGGNDKLTGRAGRDVFAWLKGNKGTDTVTDFKASEHDSINLSGLLQNAALNTNSSADDLGKYMQLTQSDNNAVLKIDAKGDANFQESNTILKTITFIDGYQYGLNGTLQNLITQKVIVLG